MFSSSGQHDTSWLTGCVGSGTIVARRRAAALAFWQGVPTPRSLDPLGGSASGISWVHAVAGMMNVPDLLDDCAMGPAAGTGPGELWQLQLQRDADLLKMTLGEVFDHQRRWAGVNVDPCRMLQHLEDGIAPYQTEWESTLDPRHPDWMFGAQDAKLLYATVRWAAPRTVVEVGSGHSTVVGTQAMLRNAADGRGGRYTIVEPFPVRVPSQLRGLCRPECVIVKFMEELPMSTFTALEAGDVLFIDSSHLIGHHFDPARQAVTQSRDVAIQLTEIVPRLRPGVLVHVHDISFPCHMWYGKVRPCWRAPEGVGCGVWGARQAASL